VEGVSRLRAQWDWIVGFVLMGMGGVMVVVSSISVSGSRYASDQLSYIVSGGLGGLLLLGAGATLVITAGLADEWRKLDRLEDALPYPKVPAPSVQVLVRRGRLLAGAGMLVAAIFLALAWSRASGEADPEPGLQALGTGIIGLIIGSLLAAFATLGMKRRIQLRKNRLFAPWLVDRPATVVAPARNGRVLVAPGLTRYHHSGCPAVAGLPTREVSRGQIPEELEPCELCEVE
jgi:hypothetical protein